MPIVCAAFFLRVKPVSTSANPPCMNITRAPPTHIHSRFVLTPRPPAPPLIAGGSGSAAKAADPLTTTTTRAKRTTTTKRRGRRNLTVPPKPTLLPRFPGAEDDGSRAQSWRLYEWLLTQSNRNYERPGAEC